MVAFIKERRNLILFTSLLIQRHLVWFSDLNDFGCNSFSSRISTNQNLRDLEKMHVCWSEYKASRNFYFLVFFLSYGCLSGILGYLSILATWILNLKFFNRYLFSKYSTEKILFKFITTYYRGTTELQSFVKKRWIHSQIEKQHQQFINQLVASSNLVSITHNTIGKFV